MKKQLISLIIIFAFLIACKEKPVKIEDAVKKEDIKNIKRDTQSEKTKPVPEFINRDTVKISSSGPFKHKIKVGDIVAFYLPQFGSTGEESDYNVDNKEVLSFVGSAFEYSNPKNAGMPGGDSGTTYLLLEAKKSGNCILKIREIFRGKLKSEMNYRIVVE